MNSRVTIITSVLNGARTLPRCLESVARQTCPCEHIIVDGGSTDGSREIARAFDQVRLIDAPGTRIAEAFNIGIENARGDFIGILNADDWYEPDAVVRSVAALEANPPAGFSYGNIILHQAGRMILNHPKPPEELAAAAQRYLPFGHISSFVRREVYREHGLYNPRYRIGMDFDFYARIIARGVTGVRVEGIIAHAELGGISSSMRKRFPEDWEISAQYLGKWRAFLELTYYYARSVIYQSVNAVPLTRFLFRRLRLASRFSELD